MKSQRSAQAHNARKLSGDVIAKLYLDLQRLRDEVRKAEISFAQKRFKEASGSEPICEFTYSVARENYQRRALLGARTRSAN
jgi:hypothetical protein